jgi:UDP-N-acetyl-D-mannosaminuronic acid dehydrogenase
MLLRDECAPDVTVFGMSHVGVSLALLCAMSGLHVTGIDINKTVLQSIMSGVSPFHEPELTEILKKMLSGKDFSLSASPVPSDFFIIAVPTPITADSFEPDLSVLQHAAYSIAPHLKIGNTVVIESTIPAGTTRMFSGWLACRKTLGYYIAAHT